MRTNLQNDGKHIDSIVLHTTCDRHKAELNEPCWHVYIASSQKTAPAVCNRRIKSAGFNGKISPSSLSRWSGGRGGNKSGQGAPQKAVRQGVRG